MQWDDVWKIIGAAIGSLGGMSVIFVAAIKFASGIIAERLSQKYELKMQQELEKYKSGLDNKIYISKAKFDTEFSLYRELSKAYFEMVASITRLIPAGYAEYPANKEDRKEYEDNLYKTAHQHTVLAQGIINSNAPFIPESLYNKYQEIIGLCREQLGVYELRWNVLYIAPQEEKEKFSREDYERSRTIQSKFKELNSELRNYLSKLDVIE